MNSCHNIDPGKRERANDDDSTHVDNELVNWKGHREALREDREVGQRVK